MTIIEVRLESLQSEDNVYKFFETIDIPKSEITSSRDIWLKSRVIGKGYNVRKKTSVRPKSVTPQLQQTQPNTQQTQPQTVSQLQAFSRNAPNLPQERPKRQIFPASTPPPNPADDFEK
eukprot:TRINITY_DN6580_c0_g1_i1.p1 TRINITY_DN6580_c0_g1~~TRINITY_DN6580_c0_g1_i1.p1  ORF type:complete len:130 (-),score=29.25 TRINITY_DN6580_c0_g1_i1:31-387(-)